MGFAFNGEALPKDCLNDWACVWEVREVRRDYKVFIPSNWKNGSGINWWEEGLPHCRAGYVSSVAEQTFRFEYVALDMFVRWTNGNVKYAVGYLDLNFWILSPASAPDFGLELHLDLICLCVEKLAAISIYKTGWGHQKGESWQKRRGPNSGVGAHQHYDISGKSKNQKRGQRMNN